MRRQLRALYYAGICCYLTVAGVRADETSFITFIEQTRLLRQKGEFAQAEKAALAAIAEALANSAAVPYIGFPLESQSNIVFVGSS